jgi:hypothetical protein
MTIDLTTFDAATATIDCSEQTHTIRWEAGELIAIDHGEAEGELALAALGGTNVACLDVLTSWRRHRHDHRLLSALTRGPGDVIPPDDDQRNPGGRAIYTLRRMRMGRGAPAVRSRARMMGGGRSGQATFYAVGGARAGAAPLGMASPPSADPPSDDEQIETLARLGGTMPWRLAATVTAALLEPATSADTPSSSPTPALTASLFGRARTTLSTWYGDPSLHIDLEVIQPAETPHLEAHPTHGIRVALPLSWVADVWGRGLAVLAERFTLAVLETGPDRFVVDTIGHDLHTRRQVAVQTLNGKQAISLDFGGSTACLFESRPGDFFSRNQKKSTARPASRSRLPTSRVTSRALAASRSALISHLATSSKRCSITSRKRAFGNVSRFCRAAVRNSVRFARRY